MAWSFYDNAGRRKGVSIGLPVPMEPWHNVGAAGEPAFTNSWVNYGSGEPVAAFRKYPDGRVKLRGVIKTGASATSAFTLPVGYRPAGGSDIAFPVYAAGTGIAYATINAAGQVIITNTTGTVVTNYTYLDAVEFDTDSATQIAGGPTGYAPTVTTALPTSPIDGQECVYRFTQSVVPADTQVLYWHLRYDSAIAKWLPVGAQEPIYAADATSRAQSFGAGPSQFSAQTLSAGVQLAGIYRVEVGSRAALCSTGTDNVWQLFHNGTAWSTVGSIGSGTPTTWSTMTGEVARATLPITTVTWGVQPGSTTQTINCQFRYLRLFPVQIG